MIDEDAVIKRVIRNDYEKIKAICKQYSSGLGVTRTDMEKYWSVKHNYYLFKSFTATPDSREERRLYRKRLSGEIFHLKELEAVGL